MSKYPDGTMDPLNPKDPLQRRLSRERPQWAIAQGLTALEELDCHRKYREALVREFGTDDICLIPALARRDQPAIHEQMSWKWAALRTALYQTEAVIGSADEFLTLQTNAISSLLSQIADLSSKLTEAEMMLSPYKGECSLEGHRALCSLVPKLIIEKAALKKELERMTAKLAT